MAVPGSFWFPFIVAILGLRLFAAGLVQDRIAELQEEFNRESNAVDKAKLLGKLGDAQFELARQEFNGGRYPEALRILEKYRDLVRTALGGLKATGVNAERKPSGFKQLQIHIRKSLREIEQIVLALPEEYQPVLEAVRRDLLKMNQELMDLLFPRTPEKNPKKEKPKGLGWR